MFFEFAGGFRGGGCGAGPGVLPQVCHLTLPVFFTSGRQFRHALAMPAPKSISDERRQVRPKGTGTFFGRKAYLERDVGRGRKMSRSPGYSATGCDVTPLRGLRGFLLVAGGFTPGYSCCAAPRRRSDQDACRAARVGHGLFMLCRYAAFGGFAWGRGFHPRLFMLRRSAAKQRRKQFFGCFRGEVEDREAAGAE